MRWNSLKRDEPYQTSRRMRIVHFSPTTSRVRAIEQFDVSRSNRRSVAASMCPIIQAEFTFLHSESRVVRDSPTTRKITQPTLIANGDNDRMVPTPLSNDLHRRIKGSELIIYPDSGHGGIFQFHDKFAPVAAELLAR